ncbi:MAG TPA: TfoX/Sxy family protein [Paucimonas sp.]|nr:TfoX/Sxy family protein [Paucimonas sp.]
MQTTRPSELRNLGPKSDAMLASVGIHTHAELAARGAIDAFVALKRAGQPVSLNLLWALEGALTGRHWRDVARDDRLRLLNELEARGLHL